MLENLDNNILSIGEGNKNKICNVSKVEDAMVGRELTEGKRKQTRVELSLSIARRCASLGADWRAQEEAVLETPG